MLDAQGNFRVTENDRITEWWAVKLRYKAVNFLADRAMIVGNCGEEYRPINFIEAMRWSVKQGKLHPDDLPVLIKYWTTTK
jgi:hypothetical protein